MDLTEFLLARIEEDEPGDHDYWCSREQVPGAACDCPRKRVLAECEAKRRIVEEHDEGCGDECVWKEHTRALRCLSLPYADHPDYNEAWRP